MATPTWGSLSKSLDDSETIEQAIERIVSEHNNDNEAHLGEDQSLQSHKASEVIDHLLGSIVSDKFAMTEIVYDGLFSSDDPWSYVGIAGIDDGPVMRLYLESGAVETSKAYFSTSIPRNFFNSSYDMLFQVCMRTGISPAADISVYFGFLSSFAVTGIGFGFVLVGGSIYCHVGTSSSYERSSAISLDVDDLHIFRAQYSATTGFVDFYIDNSLVSSIEKPSGAWSSDGGPEFGASLEDVNDGAIYFSNLIASRSL